MDTEDESLFLVVGVERLPVKQETAFILTDYLVRLNAWRKLVYGK